MNVYEHFARAAEARADRPALIGETGAKRCAVTFGELDRRVDGLVRQFRDARLEPGDRVLLAVPLSIETYALMLALFKAGAVIMFIDPSQSAGRVSQILRDWPPDALVATRAILMLRLLMPELRHVPRQFCSDGRAPGAGFLDTAPPQGKPVSACPRRPADSALLSFTSGSTAEPKAVIRTHGFLRQQLAMLERVAELREGDVDYVTMPMFVLFNLAHGVTSIIPACDMKQPGRADPAIVFEQLAAESASRIVASPALLERLASYMRRQGRRLPQLRLISTGGGPVNPSLARRLAAVAPYARLRMVYGSTEAEPIAVVDAPAVSVEDRTMMRKGGGLLVGRPVEGCDVRILGTSAGVPTGSLDGRGFEALAVASGEIGEIAVAGPHVLTSYAEASRNPETKIDVGGRVWHRTGDAGCFDDQGRLWLVGRLSARICDRRGTVYPFQVEYAASSAAGVRRAALIERHGRRTLVLEANRRLLQDSCAALLQCIENFHIDRVVTVSRIPTDRRHNAKVDYPALARLIDGRGNSLRFNLIEMISGIFRHGRRLLCSASHHFARHLESSRLRHGILAGDAEPPLMTDD